MKRFLIMLLLVLPLASHATIYKWKDSQGNEHFSDKPVKGAKRVKLPYLQTYQPIAVPQTTATESTLSKAAGYKSITITQPANEATIRNNFGSVAVSVVLDPTLASGDKLQLLLDGQPVGEPQQATAFNIEGIYRGTHSLAVQVIDAAGKPIGESGAVTIFMHRPRINMVPRKPLEMKK